MKQSTMHDSAQSAEQVFEHVRPTIVTDEGESVDTYAPEVVLEQGMGNIGNMDVRMSNEFEDQYVTKYLPRIFPWTLSYSCVCVCVCVGWGGRVSSLIFVIYR